MSAPGKSGSKYVHTNQERDNNSHDDVWGVNVVEVVAENDDQTALVRIKPATSDNQTDGSQKTQIVNGDNTPASVHTIGDQITDSEEGLVTQSVVHSKDLGGTSYHDIKGNSRGVLLQEPQWNINDIADDGTYKYFGFEDIAGHWKILRKTIATKAFRYSTGNSGYATAWTNRASQTYDIYGSTF